MAKCAWKEWWLRHQDPPHYQLTGSGKRCIIHPLKSGKWWWGCGASDNPIGEFTSEVATVREAKDQACRWFLYSSRKKSR